MHEIARNIQVSSQIIMPAAENRYNTASARERNTTHLNREAETAFVA